jgi:hypothetical protein
MTGGCRSYNTTMVVRTSESTKWIPKSRNRIENMPPNNSGNGHCQGTSPWCRPSRWSWLFAPASTMHNYCKQEQQFVTLLQAISISNSISSSSSTTPSPIHLYSSASKLRSEPSHSRQCHNKQSKRSLAQTCRLPILCRTCFQLPVCKSTHRSPKRKPQERLSPVAKQFSKTLRTQANKATRPFSIARAVPQ